MLIASQSDYMLQEGYIDIMLEFKKFTDFPRGTMYEKIGVMVPGEHFLQKRPDMVIYIRHVRAIFM